MIENLNLKLSGELPVTRKELFKLIDSWGRKGKFETIDGIKIDKCETKECYSLENLDVSQITDMSYIFRDSHYNGDLSKWNISNAINFKEEIIEIDNYLNSFNLNNDLNKN